MRARAAASSVNVDPPDLAAVPARRRGELLIRHFLDRWESGPTGDALVLLLAAAVTDEAVAAKVQANFNRLIGAPIAALGDKDADRRSALIATQLLGLLVARYILRQEPLASAPVDEIVADIAPTIQRYLTRPLAASPQVVQAGPSDRRK